MALWASCLQNFGVTQIDSIPRNKQQEKYKYIYAYVITISISSHHKRVLSINLINCPSNLQTFYEKYEYNTCISEVVQNFF